MPVKQEVQKACTGHWKIGLFEAPAKAPAQFCYGCCCICCATYQQRTELLDLTGEPYVCCGGLCPCGPLGEPQDRNCLFLEVCCCSGWALSGNRFMVQTRFDRENTPCDDCILWFTCLFVCAVQIAQCICDVPEEIELLADCIVMIVQGCMHAQQHVEIQEIKRSGYAGPPPAVLQQLPPAQQKMMQMGRPGGGGGAVPAAATTVGRPAGSQPAPQTAQQPRFQQPTYVQTTQQPRFQQPTYMQAQSQPQFVPQQAPIQVICGGCSQIFGSPASGITVACPHCTTHNQVPAQHGMPMAGAGMSPGMGYGSGFGTPGYGGGQPQQGYGGGRPQQGRPGGGMAMAGAAGAGVLGGMIMADMMF